MPANVVIKYSVMEGNQNTNQNKSFSGNSPVRVTDSAGHRWAFGPNESKTIPEPYANEVLAADNRLKEVSRS